MTKIKVIKKEVGQLPEVVEMEDTLEAMRKAVGGFSEIRRSAVCPGRFVSCHNAEMLGLEPNFSVEGHQFYGTVVFIGIDGGIFLDAPEEAMQRFTSQKGYHNLGEDHWVWR